MSRLSPNGHRAVTTAEAAGRQTAAVPQADTRPSSGQFRVEAITAEGRRAWVVVSPQGSSLYWFSDRRTAEAEVALLNEPAATPARRKVKLDDVLP